MTPPPEPPAGGPTGRDPDGTPAPRGGTGATAAPPPGPPLEIDVFTGPESALFATSSLICGTRDAVLVDAQLTRGAGRELAEWIAGKARELRAVVITHAHADHYFGVEEVLRLFPGAQVLAAPPVVAAIGAGAARQAAHWRPVLGADIPDHPVLPHPLRPLPLMIDRQLVRVLMLGQADCADATVVHVPGSRTVIAGDFVSNGTHLWTAGTTPEQRTAWLANLDRIAALAPARLIAGHRAPGQADDPDRILGFTRDYLHDFDQLLTEYPDDPEALVAAMSEAYGELTLPAFLTAGAAAGTGRAR